MTSSRIYSSSSSFSKSPSAPIDVQTTNVTRAEVDRMRSHLQNDGWDKLWIEQCTPWDLGRPTPIVEREVVTRKDEFRSFNRMLVPGCGAGYDILTLVSVGGVAFGLDISPTCIKRAKEVLGMTPEDVRKKVKLLCDDFFTFKVTDKFDFVFDNTFFCAMPPSRRGGRWGEKMREIIQKDGRLLTIVFPIFDPKDIVKREEGPPYPVTVQDYSKVLEPNGFVKDGEPYESEDSVEDRKGKEPVVWWQKKY